MRFRSSLSWRCCRRMFSRNNKWNRFTFTTPAPPHAGGQSGTGPRKWSNLSDINVRSNTIPDLLGAEESTAYCCGDGGGLSALDPSLANRFLDQITGEAAGRRMVTYCTGCQNRFIKQGVEAVHLLECLSGVKPRRAIPSPFAQWFNRFSLALAVRVQTGKSLANSSISNPQGG